MNSKNLLCLEGEPIKFNYPSYDFVRDKDGNKVLDKEMLYEISTVKNLKYRAQILSNANKNPALREGLKTLCKHNILFYINTFCYTYRTDLSRKGKNPYTNVCTFPFQDDILTWMVWSYKENVEGVIEKSRDVGATWMWVWFNSWLTLFHTGVTTLTMSQNESDVDDRTNKSIFEKIRINLRVHPEWLRGGWEENSSTDKMLVIKNPESQAESLGSVAKGTAGRSGRGSVVFYDEFAHILEASTIIEAGSALSSCKFYVSTPKGDNNEFARMANSPKVNKKSIHWSAHPLRNKIWEKKKRSEPSMTDEVFAQEYEISYTKSNIGRIFPTFNSSASQYDEDWSHVQDDPYYDYDPNYDVYTAIDFGRDMTYIGFFQIKPAHPKFRRFTKKTIIFFDEYAQSNKTAYEVRKYINDKGYRYYLHIGDMRTVVQKDALGKGWGYYLQERREIVLERDGIDLGPSINMTGSFKSIAAYIDKMNSVLNIKGAICWNERCRIAISSHNNWTYEISLYEKDIDGKPMLKYNAKPLHNKYSHPCTAIYYGVDYIHGTDTIQPSSAELDWGGFSQHLPQGL